MFRKLYKPLLILGIILTFSTLPVFWLAYSATQDLEVDFLDVGQGDAILIKTPANQNILIDGGPDSAVIKRLSENLPWWDKTIDLMILTHPHDDHVNGLNDVIRRYNVKKILYTGVIHSSPGFLTWLELIRDRQIPLVIIDRPQKIILGEECYLDFLYPMESVLGKNVDNLNNSSIVAKLVYGQTSFLLMGDAEVEVEKELLNLAPGPSPLEGEGGTIRQLAESRGEVNLQANVLKVGHHGSDTSSSQEFLEAIKPEITIIQVGADNDFGHPNLRILKRLERLGIKTFRTDLDGTIRVVSNGIKLTYNP